MQLNDRHVTLNVLYIYAHEDRNICEELHEHLEALRNDHYIHPWYDQNILPGELWRQEIKARLHSAHLILMLISADFLHSDYCYSVEMREALERQRQGEVRILSILIRPVVYEDTPIGYLPVLNYKGQALDLASDRDTAWRHIVRAIRREVFALDHAWQAEQRRQQRSQQISFQRDKLTRRLKMAGLIVPILVLVCLVWFVILPLRQVRPTAPVVNPAATATAAATSYQQYVRAQGVMAGYDVERTGYNPYERVIGSSTIARVVPAWKYAAKGTITTAPTSDGQRVYIGVGATLYALDAKLGTVLWSYMTSDTSDYGSITTPALAGELVYFGSSDNMIYALDKQSGSKVWSFDFGNGVSTSPMIINGVVYAGSQQSLDIPSAIYALNAQSGAKLWSFSPPAGEIDNPAFYDGMVYFGTSGNNPFFYALDARTGHLKWSYTNDVYVPHSGGLLFFAQAVANDIVYVGSSTQSLYALNAHTGSLLWSFATQGYIYYSPAIANGIVYVTSVDQNIYALNAKTGARIWSFTTNDQIFASPIVANGIVYIGSYDHTFYALDALTGRELWNYTTKKAIATAALVADGIIYFSSWDGYLYAYHLPRV